MSSRTLVESRAGRFAPPTKDTNVNSVFKVPGVKVTGVRIDTDNVAMWRKSLKPTNATVVPNGRPPRPSALNRYVLILFTLPDSVFESTKHSIANTSANIVSPVINAPTPMQSRRKQRYI